MSSFVHLHLHTEYSLLDGASSIPKIMKKISELGQNCVAITDHGNMYGAIDFYKEALKYNIKPIIGCEVYICDDINDSSLPPSQRKINHLVLLCKNETGYKNLIKLVSDSYIRGFYKKPRIDKKMLEEHHDGLIALSACLAGEIPQAFLNNNSERATELAIYYKNLFGDDFYIEIQNHGLDEQRKILPALSALAKKLSIEMVATNDSHYINKEDAKLQQVLMCIQTGKTLNDKNKLEMGSDEFYIKSTEEMEELFKHFPDAVENTAVVAEKCNLTFEFGQTKLPRFDIDENMSHSEYLRQLCVDGLKKRYGETLSDEITNRAEYELSVIETMGYIDYYLIVRDFVNYAKSNKIPVGPGRGSGAGSIIAYALEITDIDPIKYNLLFERFLNPERISMPDFDIDFCYERRQEVIDYVIQKYGKNHVAQIVTFGTMAAKGAIRDVGRVLGVPYSRVDAIAKSVPDKFHITINEALSDNSGKKMQQLYREDTEAKSIIDLAGEIEGLPRNTSTHAAGVVITDLPVDEYVPLAKNGDMTVTQYTMGNLEQLGLLKIDFLGLRTLTVINDAQIMINKKDSSFDIKKIPLDDADTFKMLQAGDSSGVFQFESDGMRKVLIRVSPESIEDLIACISLYRPGAAKSIDPYIKNRKNPENIKYDTPLLKDILDVTNGSLVYQEQVMEVFRKIGGYSYGRADIVRRAMSKKKLDVLEKEREAFTLGAVKNGVSEAVAQKLFNRMSDFAFYAFNKSHAAAYATVAYRTAYLKCHYRDEFTAALLTSVIDATSKLTAYIDECKECGIKILPPDINKSDGIFTVAGEAKINFGLLAIKNLGKPLIKKIKTEREKTPFKDFYDFCKRMYGLDFNRLACESLIKSGALDSLAKNRRQMLEGMNNIFSNLDSTRRNTIDGQIGFFDSPGIVPQSDEVLLKDVPEYETPDLLKMEKFVTGIYISGHPLDNYSECYSKIHATKIKNLVSEDISDIPFKDNDIVTVMGIISNLNVKITKNNSSMAFINLEDTTGSIEVIVFPAVLEANFSEIIDDNIVIVNGKISIRDDKIQIICEKIYSISKADDLAKKFVSLYIKTTSDKLSEIQSLLASQADGEVPVKIYFSDTEKTVLYKRRLLPTEKALRDLKIKLGENNIILK